MNNEERFKLALFAVIRNSSVMPAGLRLGKSAEEINDMARKTMNEIVQMCDFETLSKDFYGLDGGKASDLISR